ncbi:FAD/NAD(P)-binding protein [Chelatococcus reniformis]|uniref:FAD-dependent oxidoreductase n=1 Tax=Chelatococcus reniformis TaxID=1494448 RepID=A0A916UTD5_9HYPH|nr:FAD/NAD(P)-binding protein [Chelatococcus reniformis]GGC87500.1 FAD-dependent oxidoreductase [Chelatococcus reniformis]
MTGTTAPGALLIIGGGASGVILACHLLRRPEVDIRITLIERREQVGRGLAYSTDHPGHLLNVRAHSMSMFADDPEHFSRWLRHGDGPTDGGIDGFHFAQRSRYAHYLRHTLEQLAGAGDRFRRVEGECQALVETEAGVEARLADGSRHAGTTAFLAVGYDAPVSAVSVDEVVPDDTVLIRGTGLGMVDLFIALAARRHRGPIIALSRRGQLPQVHRQSAALPIDAAGVPFGAEMSQTLGWVRRLVRDAREQGRDWRDVVDGLRPHSQKLWQSWSVAQRRRFLTHLRPWWDSHRHRTAPQIAQVVEEALASGKLTVIAGRIAGEEAAAGRLRVAVRQRGSGAVRIVDVDRCFDCTGVSCHPLGSNPVLRDLVSRGGARPDALGLGLDVAGDGAVVGRDGRVSPRVYGVGPVTRAALWEITAVPDIRLQCAAMVERHLRRA